ncbi:MAG: hypothetical protein HC844_05160 [Tabrizicola sp.]|nr:hypothetical protein [Tabrizicola sp.]
MKPPGPVPGLEDAGKSGNGPRWACLEDGGGDLGKPLTLGDGDAPELHQLPVGCRLQLHPRMLDEPVRNDHVRSRFGDRRNLSRHCPPDHRLDHGAEQRLLRAEMGIDSLL